MGSVAMAVAHALNASTELRIVATNCFWDLESSDLSVELLCEAFARQRAWTDSFSTCASDKSSDELDTSPSSSSQTSASMSSSLSESNLSFDGSDVQDQGAMAADALSRWADLSDVETSADDLEIICVDDVEDRATLRESGPPGCWLEASQAVAPSYFTAMAGASDQPSQQVGSRRRGCRGGRKRQRAHIEG